MNKKEKNIFKNINININKNDELDLIKSSKDKVQSKVTYITLSEYIIMIQSMNLDDGIWQEIGLDYGRRWIVKDGQRFECRLFNEAKVLRKSL